MQLFVKRSAHAVEVVDVCDGCTVADVLAALEAAPGECLLQNGHPLAAAARPAPAATLALAAPLRGGMTIKVKTLTGREIEVDIEPTDTVERIKERLEEKEGIAPDQQRLIYSGKQMNDEKPVKDYNIEGGCVLHLVIALRGGA